VAGETITAMNVPVADRITQIIVNMERWRLVSSAFPPRYLMVNVPEFKLHVYDDGKEAFTMRVVVGKDFKATPIFSDNLQNIVFSPYWNIPKSIIAEEILPIMQRDPGYLSRNHMEAMRGFGKDAIQVNPWQVPWYNIHNDNFQYWLRQRPGEDNPLGLVKFLFPNSFNVYLHDTPADYLFSKTTRAFSHGCIRLEQPKRLAEFVLKDKPEWTSERIDEAMHSGEQQFVKVPSIPVYILYFTTWVNAEGEVQFRKDLYGLDKQLADQLAV
jgi:murein L,D-transpeptidase YcbB/YkuD